MSETPHVPHVPDTHVTPDDARAVDPRRAAVVEVARAFATDPTRCTWCQEHLPADAVERGREFCDRTCAKRHRWLVEDREVECRTCGGDLPDSVIQRHGRMCPTCRTEARS